jgi:xanthine dehydrogenase YagR molybdenum-binding subunit
MQELLASRAIGQARERIDGRAKVRGIAPYSYEHLVGDALYLYPVRSTIARGRIREIDTSEALQIPGVVAVLTHENAPRLRSDADREMWILQSDKVNYRGQFIGAVVADSDEIAREAAAAVRVSYDEQVPDTRLGADRDDLYKPEIVNGEYQADSWRGDPYAAFASAPIMLDETYTTPMEHNNPMEPHATVARWQGGELALYDSTQSVHGVRDGMAELFGLPPDRIRVLTAHVGGGFGAKGWYHSNVVLAVLAAQMVEGRPVKFALTRQEMFAIPGYRTPTIQRIRLGADANGRLSAILYDAVEETSKIKEFAEQTATPTRSMYAAENLETSHRLAALDLPVPTWMRAPGECPGMFGLESAMDELAIRCGLDPIELRIRNEPRVDPESGKPFSSRNLVACLREGASRFGWENRVPSPRTRLVNGWWVGTGVASSVYPVYRMPGSEARINSLAGGRYRVQIGAVDLGTGTWTTLGQIAADALRVSPDSIDVEIGDSALPTASVAGGSSGMTSWGSAIVAAAEAFREQHGTNPEPGESAHARTPENPDADRYAMSAYGAQFAEVRVHADTGEIRVPRMLGVFAAGRIINPRTAQSQFLGGMTMGLSMALFEESVLDPRFGHVVNHDFASYHIATNADVGSMEATWINEEDSHVNAMGSKGIGEIGIVGTAAAIANAAYHATGIRVRDLPITPDKMLST